MLAGRERERGAAPAARGTATRTVHPRPGPCLRILGVPGAPAASGARLAGCARTRVRLSGVARTPALVDRAAALAVPDGVLAGPSAARIHGLPVDDPRSWIAVPPAARLRIRGLSVLRDRLSRHDVEFVGGVLITGQPRTVFDCLRILRQRQNTIRQLLQDRRFGNGSRSGTAQSVPETTIKARPRLGG